MNLVIVALSLTIVVIILNITKYFKQKYFRRFKIHDDKKLLFPSKSRQRLPLSPKSIGPDILADPDILIIGAGVAGSALASALARDGRKVTLVEKSMARPDRIVGELLQPGGFRALEELGLQDCVADVDAQIVEGYVVEKGDKTVPVMYPDGFTGRAFQHGHFVDALRSNAIRQPGVNIVVGTATKLLEDKDGKVCGVVISQNSDEEKELPAGLTVVADGCFSRLRKQVVGQMPTVESHFIALEMLHCPQLKKNCAEMIITTENPILVYQISEEKTRILIDCKQPNLPKNLREFLKETVYQKLPEHLKPAFQESIECGKIKVMPNSFLPPSMLRKRGVLCVGDAYNMRHPLTGGGMTVALCDVIILTKLFRQVSDFNDKVEMEELAKVWYDERRREHSFVVNILSMALYQLFSAKDESTNELKEACFDYFQLGGRCVEGPVQLLSILNPRPLLFVSHFFAVALFAIFRIFKAEKTLLIHRAIVKSFLVLYTACNIIFPLIRTEVPTFIF